ncbi:MAG: DUF3347 domain-containing protein [Bacteroidia bacterium]
MKKINLKLMLALLGGSLIMTSCGNSSITENDRSNNDPDAKEENRNLSANTGETKGDLSIVLSDYFALNESLAQDDASGAAKAAEKLAVSLKEFKDSGLLEDEQKEVAEIMESAIENADHISKNAGEIGHQREHLVSLSIDVKDLIALVGTSQKLYEYFCPMADDRKGAIWISNKEEISNPYMGSAMPTCGKINREIN